ncbi:hypothetical protein HanXRQr2_Chr17g0787141 [Helianthus annuus]|uniref:Uncharacterized protein n=1 Tax=Helianthus annuus TaxID=4232 RepID=A0A251RMC2_HELAN|nr:uncharacterized protein LOC110922371 [Helianthus annuus]KAF5754071.1 hypothetical protein HanXRQr2_Chr17g0787141 [Helianthus annuus]KAJ0428039.1 hypothetical protein HanHA300_Chr17g0641751 [Helianthus annuus]KAJ0432009.1 hypothetical protein HanIR_Chr17g0854631 [Helianthus annuus]KAJ0446350.1 hypothetical protein HanHA89_Chr17g0693351 [Helianthus annuus]KAJ0811846.1 hypothetical protein HanPSC8_Chr17g0755331 [Helianthus annuus]
MADEFSFTDSEDERAVEDVLSQALDHSVLEQIAAINCSSFSSKDNLPFDLENRFRKLKSLPTATTATGARFPPSKSKSFIPRSGADSVDFERVSDLKNGSDKPSPFTGDPKQRSEEYSDEKKGSNSRSKLKSDFRKTKSLKSDFRKTKSLKSESSPSSDDSEQHSDENLDEKIGTNYSRSKPKSSSNSKKFRETKSLKSKSRNDSSESSLEHSDGNLDEKTCTDSRSKLKSSSNSRKTKSLKSKSRTDSWSVSSPESESRSVSPARRGIGCLWCSPKKEKRKQGKENLNRLSSFSSSLGNDYEYDVEFLKTFSVKEQKKIMRKAMKEEEKINREAEKIVKWAKQASSRMMDVHVSGGVDDDLSDLEK